MATINRREFFGAASAIGIAGCLSAQSGRQDLWGGPVVDVHHHFRPVLEANIVHLDGCGVSNAFVLARQNTIEQVKELEAKYPARILGFAASTDITKEDAAKLLTQAVKDGAHGFGEIKFHVAADGPEMRRMYALAAELKVPIMIHFQEVPHTPTEGVFNTGFKQFETVLKAFPKTTFVGHADAFWANVSADYNNEVAYPSGPIKRGGVTDKLLSDYGNLFGDLSANSGNNALSRDADFTKDFLARHQDKLMFGSDCSCTDGKGGGISQNNNPTAARLAGKCVARETLTVLKKSASPSAFRKMTWSNSHKVYQIATT